MTKSIKGIIEKYSEKDWYIIGVIHDKLTIIVTDMEKAKRSIDPRDMVMIELRLKRKKEKFKCSGTKTEK